jgi:hypothetical protein
VFLRQAVGGTKLVPIGNITMIAAALIEYDGVACHVKVKLRISSGHPVFFRHSADTDATQLIG